MASVNWMKSTTSNAAALAYHLDQEKRLAGEHSNTDINKELTPQNYTIGCENYMAALTAMKARTKAVDKEKPPQRRRKDRVTCCFLEIPCPAVITGQGKSADFFRAVHDEYEKFFGEENVHGSFVHVDEVHIYMDKSDKLRQSCEHMHTLVSAYTPEKGINGKAFETLPRLHQLNKALDKMCYEKFGVHLNTGEIPDKKTVEALKQESVERTTSERLIKAQAQLESNISILQERERKLSERVNLLNDIAELQNKCEDTQQLDRAIDTTLLLSKIKAWAMAVKQVLSYHKEERNADFVEISANFEM